MRVYRGRGIGDVYYEIIRDLMKHGRRVTVRGHDCMEFPDRVVLEYAEPGYCWMCIPGRKWNPFLALAEIPWILSGNGNVEWISYFSSKMRDFADGDENFHGAYGLRLRKWPVPQDKVTTDQIDWVVRKLKADPFSRQAVMMLWNPDMDNFVTSKDYPCNNWVAYELRDGVLNQSVVIRSNDLVWGTPINAVQFTHIHAYVAGLLGAKMGTLTYFIQNLHVYIDQYKSTLANLVEQAYDEEHPIEAEKAEYFQIFNDKELNEFINYVNTFRPGLTQEPPMVGACSNKYLQAIVEALRLFCQLKTPKITADATVEETASAMETWLVKPFDWLAVDFYRDSKNELARKAALAVKYT
jgi:thymidylate synthase